MLFDSKGLIGAPVVKSCGCGRKYTANDWLDLIPIGFMDGYNDYTLLDMRNCPCGSTICVESLIYCDESKGLPEHMGNQALLAAQRELELRLFLRAIDRAFGVDPEPMNQSRISTIPAPAS